MFYKHARFILAIAGIAIGMAGYYLGTVCQVSYGQVLWLGTMLAFAVGGFGIGGLIQKLSISSHTDQDIRELLTKADQALYKAKEQKNAVITVADL